MLEDGLSYPLRGDWLGRIVIGGVLGFLSILVIPAFAITGYTLDVIRQTIEGEDEPPDWDDWGALIVDGIKVTVVWFAYSIVPTVVFMGIGFVFLGIGGAAGDTGGSIMAGFGIMAFLLFIPVMMIAYYLVPAALSNMASEDRFGAAFDVGALTDVVLTSEYFVAVLMPIVVGVLINIVTSFLAFTVIGLVLVPFVSFYGQVAIFRMFGTAFAETGGKRIETSEEPAGKTAV